MSGILEGEMRVLSLFRFLSTQVASTHADILKKKYKERKSSGISLSRISYY